MSPAVPLLLSSSQPDIQLLKRLAVAQNVALVVASIVGGVVLAAWLLPAIARWLPPGWSAMKANTAICVLLGAISLGNSGIASSPQRLMGSRILGGLMFIIAASVLVESRTGVSTGLDTVLVADRGAELPGRMSIQSGIFFALLGLTLIWPRARKSGLSPVVDSLTLGLVVLALVIFAGYCFDASRLFGQSLATRTSPQTLASMVLLTFVRVSRRAEYGYFSVLVGVGIGSRIARLLLPIMLLLPFLLVICGANLVAAGWLSLPYSQALTAAFASITLFVVVIWMAWRINDLERDLRDISLTDELTGVLNRRGFTLLGEQALRDAQRQQQPLTVLFFDLDGLKSANDSFGHEVGSQFLTSVATLLRTHFKGSDIVGRVGGDEFAVVTQPQSAQRLLNRLGEEVKVLNQARTRPYDVSYSVGDATSDPNAVETFGDLVRRADIRMYEQKRSKKARS